MKNWGKLHFHVHIVNDVPYGDPRLEDERRWNEVAPEPRDGVWFIVAVDGTIISAEMDPSQSMIVGHDIIEIEHEGPGEAIRGRRWDGEKIV